MKKLLYISLAVAATSIVSCNDKADNTSVPSAAALTDKVKAETAENDSNKVQEVTGVVVDGARRLIYLAVDNDTIEFELDSSEDVSWEEGDQLTVRYYKRYQGDSVVKVINNSEA